MVVAGLLLQDAAGALGVTAAGASLLLATRVLEGIGFLAVTVTVTVTVTVAAPSLIIAGVKQLRAPGADRRRAVDRTEPRAFSGPSAAR
jgi:predicted phage tail protein